MRVVIVGATGNIGTSLIRALADEPRVTSVLGMARRLPDWQAAKTEWVAADIATDDLAPHFRGAAAVVHLAWLFQPIRDPITTWNTNVAGGMRVFQAVAEAGVPVLVHSSSVGAYSPRRDDEPVDESWPTDGWPAAAYGREKAYLERVLDAFEGRHPDIRVVRMRSGFIFKRESAAQQRRLFAGPLLPRSLLRPGRLPFVPGPRGLRLPVLHAEDAGQAYRQAILQPVSGPFNLAAEPVVTIDSLAELFQARTVELPPGLIRAALAAGWHLRLVPASPELFDLAMHLPVMDIGRAHRELGWAPRHTAIDAVREFIEGLQENAGMATPPLTATGRQR
jgi:nucleoside-diphosphate-sugar epimerase